MVDQGVVGSGLCYVGMAWCVEQRGPVFTSAFTPLIQIFVATVGFFILHERIYPGRLNLSYFFSTISISAHLLIENMVTSFVDEQCRRIYHSCNRSLYPALGQKQGD